MRMPSLLDSEYSHLQTQSLELHGAFAKSDLNADSVLTGPLLERDPLFIRSRQERQFECPFRAETPRSREQR
jgi:hypothetical protein